MRAVTKRAAVWRYAVFYISCHSDAFGDALGDERTGAVKVVSRSSSSISSQGSGEGWDKGSGVFEVIGPATLTRASSKRPGNFFPLRCALFRIPLQARQLKEYSSRYALKSASLLWRERTRGSLHVSNICDSNNPPPALGHCPPAVSIP